MRLMAVRVGAEQGKNNFTQKFYCKIQRIQLK